MLHRIAAFTAGMVWLAMVVLTAATNVTYVLNNGERHSGQLVYHRDANLRLIENGQERSFPISQVAAILYNGGNPPASELAQLPISNNPPELERHILVLQNGRVIHGKVYRWDADSLMFDSIAGRGTYNASDVARLYLSGPPARNVFAGSTESSEGAAGQPQMTVHVTANQPWTDTGLLVRQGESIAFSASGTIEFGKDMSAGPDGNRDLPARVAYPVRNMPVGGLIGRVGTSAPFAIGSTTSPVPMPVNGRLFIGVNDDDHKDNTGAFNVDIYRR